MQLAVNEYAQGNPTIGVKVDVVGTDGQAARARTGATTLARDGVVAVIGPDTSAQAEATGSVFDASHIPTITPSATAVDLAQQGWLYFHRTVPDEGIQGSAAVDYLAKHQRAATVAVIDDGSPFGAGVAKAAEGELAVDNVSASVTGTVATGTEPAGHLVSRLVAADPSAVLFAGDGAGAARLLVALRSGGYQGALLDAVAALPSGPGDEPALLSGAGSQAEGALITCPCTDPNRGSGVDVVFTTAYRAAYGVAPDSTAASAYDATNFVLAAMKSGATDRAGVQAYLGSNSYAGITGTLRFGPGGNISSTSVTVYQVKAGTLTVVGSQASSLSGS